MSESAYERIGWAAMAVLSGLLVAGPFVVGCGRQVEEGAPPPSPSAQAYYTRWHTFHTGAITDATGATMNVEGLAVVGVQVAGLVTATVGCQASIDGANYHAVQWTGLGDGAVSTSTAADGLYLVGVSGVRLLRCPLTSYISGTITVRGNGMAVGVVDLANAVIGAGSNTIGDVTVSSIVAPGGKAASTTLTHAPGTSNTAAVVTRTAAGVGSWVVGMVSGAYDEAPTGGLVKLEDDSGVVWQVPITSEGAFFFPWVPGLKLTANSPITLTLAAGGAGVTGTINGHVWTE